MNSIYQHMYGGYYELLHIARDKRTRNKRAVYRHVWPFESDVVWVRAWREFDERFRPVTDAEFEYAKAGDAEYAKAEITRARGRNDD